MVLVAKLLADMTLSVQTVSLPSSKTESHSNTHEIQGTLIPRSCFQSSRMLTPWIMRVMVHMSLVSLLLTTSGEHLSRKRNDYVSLFHRLKGVAPDAQLLIYKIFSDVRLVR